MNSSFCIKTYEKWLKIYAAAEKIGNPNKWLIANYFDSLVSEPSEQQKSYVEIIESKIGEEGHSLIEETKVSFEKTKTKKNQIYQQLEEFLKCNNLKPDVTPQVH